MKSLIDVSIIIPCYNSFKLMGRCLESLENQTYKNFEVIIIDDCSTDNSYNDLLKYKETSNIDFKVYKNKVNCGPGESRNVGISYAKGEWLAFSDSDDWYVEDFIEKMLKKAVEKKADIVMCDHNYVYSDGRLEKCNAMNFFNDSSTKRDFIAYSRTSLWRLFIKKSLFNDIKIPKLYNGEDLAVVPQLLAKSDVIAVEHEALYNYLVRGDSISLKPNKRVYASLIEAFSIVQNSIKKRYPLECEFIGIKTILYGVTLNAFKAGISRKELYRILKAFNEEYPKWPKNPHIKKLGLFKRVYLKSIYFRLYIFNKLYAQIHFRLTK
ncbi:glycosyltransferase family A protein [Herbivorax sp. ANBcel31]|uniref:glycosyltransferase family 2 protein n=1 Tax=Herbivorax sp. ANBcel31 TaxID=3069754 RepID=UPI0027ADB228|nr:glycosyltransferase family A protein [Herbivorax sp. ANBcel31]MDQ2085662.1 glycosyltransferase family A protein [Herbivorax sp. ANBcel31]